MAHASAVETSDPKDAPAVADAPTRPACDGVKGGDERPEGGHEILNGGGQGGAGGGEARAPQPESKCLAVPEWACKALADPWGTEDVNLMRAMASACQALGLGTSGISTTPLRPKLRGLLGKPVVPRLSSRALLTAPTDAPASPGRIMLSARSSSSPCLLPPSAGTRPRALFARPSSARTLSKLPPPLPAHCNPNKPEDSAPPPSAVADHPLPQQHRPSTSDAPASARPASDTPPDTYPAPKAPLRATPLLQRPASAAPLCSRLGPRTATGADPAPLRTRGSSPKLLPTQGPKGKGGGGKKRPSSAAPNSARGVRSTPRPLARSVSVPVPRPQRLDSDTLRCMFLAQALSYVGTPYIKLAANKGPPQTAMPSLSILAPVAGAHQRPGLALDCSALVRQCLYDLRSYLGFVVGGWNQCYQYDTLPVCADTIEDLRPGDLVFISGVYFDEKRKAKPHNLTHVEIYFPVHEDYAFESKTYHSMQYYFRRIDTWLDGECRSHCPLHRWQNG